jgi:FAD binding domain/Berberine and berberine like
MIDRRPRLIVRCRGAADIIAALRFAQDEHLAVSIRSSGHGAAGYAVCDAGLVIDLTELKSVQVDPVAQRAWAEPGVTWADFDYETQAFCLATPGGTVSSTAIAGLTLGGGIGWLSSSYGLTCDNLLAATVITASGSLLRASDTINADLFWALRGGGGNFGVVSLFEFRLHKVVRVLAGSMRVSLERAGEVLRSFRELSESVPDEVTLCPTFFSSSSGVPYLSVDFCYNGAISAGLDFARDVERRFRPEVNTLAVQPYLRWQQYLDSSFAERLRGYWKTAYLDNLEDELIDLVVDFYRRAPSPKSTVILEHFHGQMTRLGNGDSAFGNRRKAFSLLITTRWRNQADDESNISWANTFYTALQRFTDGSGYLNYVGDVEEHRLRLAYGHANYERLVSIKRKYDPTNFFQMNHNIRPYQ